MTTIRRSHYYLPRKANEGNGIQVVMDTEALTVPDRTADVMLKVLYRLYKEEGGDFYGALGKTA